KALRVFGSSIKQIKKNGDFSELIGSASAPNEEDLYVNLGSGKLQVKELLTKLPSLQKGDKESEYEESLSKADEYSKKLTGDVRRRANKDNAVIVDGMDDVMVRMARCCNPIPGDPIVGYITRGRGITVHTSECTRVDAGDIGRVIRVEWNPDFSFKHPVNVRVITHDKPGILSQISKVINANGVNIRSALAKSMPDRKGSFVFEVEVKDYAELVKTISAIEGVEEVISVSRA